MIVKTLHVYVSLIIDVYVLDLYDGTICMFPLVNISYTNINRTRRCRYIYILYIYLHILYNRKHFRRIVTKEVVIELQV